MYAFFYISLSPSNFADVLSKYMANLTASCLAARHVLVIYSQADIPFVPRSRLITVKHLE